MLTVETRLVPCTVHNMSLGGVFVRGPALPIETRVTLRFGLETLRDLEVACIARWSTADGTGLQFDGLRAADTYALAKFIRAHARATARTPVSDILRGVIPFSERRERT